MNRGFTLTELLVVIFIIAVLIAILIPTISSVQRSAMTADTKNLISQLSSAITRYHQDFNAFPGPFSNNQIAAGGTPRIGQTGPVLSGASDITHSENLALALLGGLRFDGTTFTFDASDTQQARGTVSLNPSAPKRHAAYMKVRDGTLSNGRMADTYPGMSDSAVPEFVDTWPLDEKLPIIYVRARSGAGGIISIDGKDDSGADVLLYGRPTQYNLPEISPYLRPGDGLSALGDLSDGSKVSDEAKGNALWYFAHPSLHGGSNAGGTPVEKDRFVLFAAGPDRIFGTQDDIRSFGN